MVHDKPKGKNIHVTPCIKGTWKICIDLLSVTVSILYKVLVSFLLFGSYWNLVFIMHSSHYSALIDFILFHYVCCIYACW